MFISEDVTKNGTVIDCRRREARLESLERQALKRTRSFQLYIGLSAGTTIITLLQKVRKSHTRQIVH